MNELISIVVPVYNVEKYLNKCIESIINQSYSNLEIILVDDGSKDSSGIMCDSYILKDKRIKVIHKENGGLSDARNAGIEIAKGEYLSFIDSDDYVHKDFIKVLYGLCIKYNSDISMCGAFETSKDEDFNFNLEQGNECIKYSRGILEKKESIYCVAWNKLYKKEIFKHIRYPKGKLHEDVAVINKILYYSNKIAITDLRLYFYYNNPNSIMRSTFSIKRLDVLDVIYDSYIFFLEKNEIQYAYNSLNDYIDTALFLYKECQVLGKDSKKIEKQLLKKYSKEYIKVLENINMSVIKKIKYIIYRFIPKLYLVVSK